MNKYNDFLYTILLIFLVSNCCSAAKDLSKKPFPSKDEYRTANIVVGSKVTGTLNTRIDVVVDPTWEQWLFTRHPETLELLRRRNATHMRLMVGQNQWVKNTIPQIASDPTDPKSWDFTGVDKIIQPILDMHYPSYGKECGADHSPIFSIAEPPPFLTNEKHEITDLKGFTEYAANLVRYYNGPGIGLKDGTILRSPNKHPIRYWGILNETDYIDMTPGDYAKTYDTVSEAMRKVDPNIQIVALDLGCGNGTWETEYYFKPFLDKVKTKVDIFGVHYYMNSKDNDTDINVFTNVPISGERTKSFLAVLKGKGYRAPLWVTENNVNAGIEKDRIDPRNSTIFFAAWRPYVFSRVAQAGADALYQFEFAGTKEFGEIDKETGKPFVTYWVDYLLSRCFPAGMPMQILPIKYQSDINNIEALAVKRSDGSMIIMIVNHAVLNGGDVNGTGVPYHIKVDKSLLGHHKNVTIVKIDKKTDLNKGPIECRIKPSTRLDVDMNGYSVAFIKLL